MKTILTILTLFAANIHYAQSYGVISGIVWDEDYGEPAMFINVTLENRLNYLKTCTDIDGNYRFSNVPLGTYTLTFESYGVTTKVTTPIVLDSNEVIVVPLQTINSEIELTFCYFTPRYRTPEKPVMNRDELLENVNKFQLVELAQGISSKLSESNSGKLSFRGRTENQLQFIDGVKTREIHSLPSSSLKTLTVYDGFIPANFGDVTGAVIVVETMGYFDLLREWENSK